MAFFLKCLITSEDQELLGKINEYLNAELSPDFEEDVEPEYLEVFSRLEDIEFYQESDLLKGRVFLTWYEQPEVSALQLIHALKLFKQLELILFEIDDYADSSDDPDIDMQGYIYRNKNGEIERLSYEQAELELDSSLLTQMTHRLER